MPTTSHRSLTVDYHEGVFNAKLQAENAQSFWFQMSNRQKQQLVPSLGPENTQALNRYTYVRNNPLNYIDPSGHEWVEYEGHISIGYANWLIAGLGLAIAGQENALREIDSLLQYLSSQEVDYEMVKYALIGIGTILGAIVCAGLCAAVAAFVFGGIGLAIGKAMEDANQEDLDQLIAETKRLRAEVKMRLNYLNNVRNALQKEVIEAILEKRDSIYVKIEVGFPSVIKVTIDDTVLPFR